jgi:hypothetical protein
VFVLSRKKASQNAVAIHARSRGQLYSQHRPCVLNISPRGFFPSYGQYLILKSGGTVSLLVASLRLTQKPQSIFIFRRQIFENGSFVKAANRFSYAFREAEIS